MQMTALRAAADAERQFATYKTLRRFAALTNDAQSRTWQTGVESIWTSRARGAPGSMPNLISKRS